MCVLDPIFVTGEGIKMHGDGYFRRQLFRAHHKQKPFANKSTNKLKTDQSQSFGKLQEI